MDTRQFLKTILPSEGTVIIAVNDGTFRHYAFPSIDKAAEFALQQDAQGKTVYHACSAYKPGAKTRNKDTWLSAKSFWCDIDCGETKAAEGKGYATKQEAMLALGTWCKKVNLPLPLFISSGWGIHAYWPMQEAISPDDWVKLAETLKGAMSEAGLLVDPSRTSDMSSVLRPVGTHNYKRTPARNVVSSVEAFDPLPNAIVVDAIRAMQKLPERPEWMPAPTDELVERTYPDYTYDIDQIADRCAQMRNLRDTQGNASFETWRCAIGIIKCAKAPIDVAIKWSKRRAETGHTNTDVETRYNTWNSGPTTCETFKKHCPELCKGCQHKCKTPLMLGIVPPEPKSTVVTNVVATATNNIQVPPLPHGYEFDFNTWKMLRHLKDKDGNQLPPRVFCNMLIYLFERVRDENGEYLAHGKAIYKDGKNKSHVIDLHIPVECIATGGRDLLRALGKNEITCSNGKEAANDMQSYLKDSLGDMRLHKDIIDTYDCFGWQSDGSFLIGNRLYSKGGTVTEVLLSGRAKAKASAFPTPKGSLSDYADKVNWIYNRPGMQCFQYLICSLWAAPLASLCNPEYKGMPCAVTGAASGKGKTTAAHVALYAYGDAATELTMSGSVGSTDNAQGATLGVLQNLPVLLDEITNKSSAKLSELCYSLPNGLEKVRMTSKGGKIGFSDRNSWRTHVALTGNTNISAQLSLNGQTEAEAMRVFEINIDNYDIPMLDQLAVSTAIAAIDRCKGVAGEAITKYLVDHRSEVETAISDELIALRNSSLISSDQKYRFYRYHMACTLVMARIARELGVCAFDVDALKAFAAEAFDALCAQVKSANVFSPEEYLAQMMTDFSPRIIQTETLDPPDRHQRYKVYLNAAGGPVGRSIRGSDGMKDSYDGQMYLASKAISDWCVEHRVPRAVLLNYLKKKSALVSSGVFFTLGRGTTTESTQCRCWCINLYKLEAAK